VKLVRRLIYFSSAFILVSGTGLAFLHQMGLFEVSSIGVEVLSSGDDAKGTPGDDVELRTRLEKRLGTFAHKRIWEIDLGQMKAAIMHDHWVGDVRISRWFPNEIRVRVSARTPVLVLVGAKGEMIPVGEDASLMGELAPERLPDAPLLRGEFFVTDRVKREKAVAFVLGLPERGALSRRNISEITWTQDEGYTLTMINPKVEVRLGEDRASLKIARVTQVLNYLSANHLKSHVIDASFSKKVLVRLRKGP
jgi:cell division septal protein FtsQ